VTKREAKIIEAMDELTELVSWLVHRTNSGDIGGDKAIVKVRGLLDEARQGMAPGRPKQSIFEVLPNLTFAAECMKP